METSNVYIHFTTALFWICFDWATAGVFLSCGVEWVDAALGVLSSSLLHEDSLFINVYNPAETVELVPTGCLFLSFLLCIIFCTTFSSFLYTDMVHPSVHLFSSNLIRYGSYANRLRCCEIRFSSCRKSPAMRLCLRLIFHVLTNNVVKMNAVLRQIASNFLGDYLHRLQNTTTQKPKKSKEN